MPRAAPPTVLTDDELEAVLHQPHTSTAVGLRSRALLVVLARGGLRLAEAFRLVPGDIHVGFGKLTLVVRDADGEADRQVVLVGEAGATLGVWLAGRAAAELDGNAIFCTLHSNLNRRPAGAVLRRAHVHEALRVISDAVGLRCCVTPTILRATGAAQLLRAGRSHAEVIQFLGMGEGRYSELYVWEIARQIEEAKLELEFGPLGQDWRLHTDDD